MTPADQRGGEPDDPGEGRDDDGPVTCGAGTAGDAEPTPTPFGSVIRIRRLQHGFRNCYLAVTSLLLRRTAGQEAAQGAVQSQVGGRVTEATARTYLDDEIIKDMARRMLFEVAGERPGADLIVPLS
jgi:hypothetical protein